MVYRRCAEAVGTGAGRAGITQALDDGTLSRFMEATGLGSVLPPARPLLPLCGPLTWRRGANPNNGPVRRAGRAPGTGVVTLPTAEELPEMYVYLNPGARRR